MNKFHIKNVDTFHNKTQHKDVILKTKEKLKIMRVNIVDNNVTYTKNHKNHEISENK